VEFIPYFLGLVAWVGLAMASFLLWPLTALFRRLRGGKSAPPAEMTGEAPAAPEATGEGGGEGA
jgi:hypothetical protein